MICPRCKSPVPPGQLACSCFLKRAEQELRERALKNFEHYGRLRIGPATSGKHIYPLDSGLSLCGVSRYKNANRFDATPIYKLNFEDIWKHWTPGLCCGECSRIVAEALGFKSKEAKDRASAR